MDIVSPAQWGARVDYDTKTWRPWAPDKWVIHYGGSAVRGAYDGVEREMQVLRAWEHYHLQRMRGIAYNYGIGNSGTLFRLRGENASGATSGDEDEDGIAEYYEARAVVFILGGDQKPTQAALDTFSEFWATDPMRVIGHRDSTSTPCPGEHLYAWLKAKGYEEVITRDSKADDGSPTLAPAYQRMVDLGIFSQHTQPGGVAFNDEVAVFMERMLKIIGMASGLTESQVRTIVKDVVASTRLDPS